MKHITLLLITILIFTFMGCNDRNVLEPTSNNQIAKLNLSIADVAQETLTPFYPDFPSGYASGMVVGGTGLEQQPAEIIVKIPQHVTIE